MKEVFIPIVINIAELKSHSWTEDTIILNDYFKTSDLLKKYCGENSELSWNEGDVSFHEFTYPGMLRDYSINRLYTEEMHFNRDLVIEETGSFYRFKVDLTESSCTFKLEKVEEYNRPQLVSPRVEFLFIVKMTVPDDFVMNVHGTIALNEQCGIDDIEFNKEVTDYFFTLNDIVKEKIDSVTTNKIQKYVQKYNVENNSDPEKMLYFDGVSYIPNDFVRRTTTECKFSIMEIPVVGISSEEGLKIVPDFQFIPDEIINRIFTIHLNNGTKETFKVSIPEYKINPNDDIIYTRILDAIEPSLKKRVSEDVHYEYELLGISTSPDGNIINTADYKFSENDDIYFIWNKIEVIRDDNNTIVDPVDLDYIPAGKLQSINDCLFVTPKDGTIVDKIEFCNNYYYLLCKNNHIYKLDKNFNIVNDLNLSAYNKDIEKNDIFVSGNVLIIKAGKYILTDNETVKNNSSVNENTLVISDGDTEQKINTKSIVKINVR